MKKAIEQAQELDKTIEEAAQATTEDIENVQQEEQQEIPAVTLDELEGMDMGAFAFEDKPEAPKEFRIADDSCADWAVRKITEERAELTRIKTLAAAEIARIEEKVAAAERRYENGTNFLTDKLAQYFETIEPKKTKTKHSYRLLSGTLVKKIGGQSLQQDEGKLLEYLKKTGNTDMIKVTEKPAWGEFKKGLEIIAGQVIDKETGEIVEGVNIETKPDTFTVDI